MANDIHVALSNFFMSYSALCFLLGLIVYVCTPLICQDEWNSQSDVSDRSFVSTATPCPLDQIWLIHGTIAMVYYAFSGLRSMRTTMVVVL